MMEIRIPQAIQHASHIIFTAAEREGGYYAIPYKMRRGGL
jgi:hypothetical protein